MERTTEAQIDTTTDEIDPETGLTFWEQLAIDNMKIIKEEWCS